MIIGSKVIIREKREGDARDDYTWETDAELAQLDAATRVTISFSEYLLAHAYELHHCPPSSHRFAVDTLDGKHIGNCSFYNINETEGEAELGIMLGNRDYWNQGYGRDTVLTLLNYIFCKTSLNRVYLKTLESNKRAQKCFQKCGLAPYGRLARDGFNFVLMEIYRNQWQEQKPKSAAGS